MREKLIKSMSILIFLISFLGCTNIPKKNWIIPSKDKLSLNLKPGDILIKEKEFSIYGVFGHSAIMKNKVFVVDYPMLGETSYEIPLRYWLEKNRGFIVLRYKYMNDIFLKKLLENIDNYQYLPYKITFNKKEDKGFYCSQYIWFLYYKTAKDLGFDLDLDSDKGFFIFPYDFYNSPLLFEVKK